MKDPFAERTTPWWQRVWRREKRRSVAPKGWARFAGAVGPFVLFLLPAGHNMDLLTKLAISFAVLAAPPALVELWWKRRRRRAAEPILVRSDANGQSLAR